jgi:hypothetical protein
MRYGRNIVTASVHHGGEEYQPRDIPPLNCSSQSSLPAKKTMNSFSAFF